MPIFDELYNVYEDKDLYQSGQFELPHNEIHYRDEYKNRQCYCILPYPKSPYQQLPPRYSGQFPPTPHCWHCGVAANCDQPNK